ncbi:uncharacterized protein C2845_PM07G05060 [Panicum miliaceum]|uniref:RBR-type E3 ubiquitin transferase n=1 Tax=Panicum miliaceum TaxID=4540 RepID=A0A3L6SIB3_PANMI|nr:uncharacterized protein C2845_PM07G05060 [Panicum miliaceum]
MTAAGDDDLAALRLACSAAVSACDLDYAFQLQLDEAIQASLRAHTSISSPNAASSSWTQAAPTLDEPSSDVAYALELQATDLALAEQDRRDALACRAAHSQAAASVRIAAHDALFPRELAAIPEDRWARDGDCFERPLELASSSSSPLFRVFFKGMASGEAVGPRDRDPGLAVLAVALCGPQGNVVLRIQKPVGEVFVGDGEVLEVMALLEGLHAALELDIRSVKVITDHKTLHNHMLGIWHPSGKKLADIIDQVLTVRRKLEQCEISLVEPNQVSVFHADSAGSFCMSCMVPWHDMMSCDEYKTRYPYAHPEDARLENLAKTRLWRQCVKCRHMIELAEGCYHVTCVCGHEFCYTCGKEWKEKKATCSCLLWDEGNIITAQR